MAQGLKMVVDTSVWIDYYRNDETPHGEALDAAIELDRVFVPDVVLLEILRGVTSQKVARAMQVEFENYELVQIGGAEMAIAAANNYRSLREKGVTIRSTIDLMIGTWCISHDIPLLHNDRDFEMMERHLGLECVPVEKYR